MGQYRNMNEELGAHLQLRVVTEDTAFTYNSGKTTHGYDRTGTEHLNAGAIILAAEGYQSEVKEGTEIPGLIERILTLGKDDSFQEIYQDESMTGTKIGFYRVGNMDEILQKSVPVPEQLAQEFTETYNAWSDADWYMQNVADAGIRGEYEAYRGVMDAKAEGLLPADYNDDAVKKQVMEHPEEFLDSEIWGELAKNVPEYNKQKSMRNEGAERLSELIVEIQEAVGLSCEKESVKKQNKKTEMTLD